MTTMGMNSRIIASLNYLAPDPKFQAEKPFTCFLDLSKIPQAKTTNIVTQTVEQVSIADVRSAVDDLSLDKQGFEVADLGQRFLITDFDDEQWIREVYYPFVCGFLVDKLGAKDAHVFEHQLRYRHPGFGQTSLRGASGFDPPVSQVHADQTPVAARARFRRHWPGFSEDLFCDRLQIINVWRPLVDIVTEWPLALCDFRSINGERDLRASDIVKPDYIGESYVATHDPSHAWYFLSSQTFQEGWLLKLYDSKPGVPNTVLHTAIDIGEGPTARKSCEVRVLVRS